MLENVEKNRGGVQLVKCVKIITYDDDLIRLRTGRRGVLFANDIG